MAKSESLVLTTSAFPSGQPIPAEHSCQGADRSPALTWSGDVAGVKSWTLVVDDPDAPGGTFVHWLAYDLPPATRGMPAGVPAGDSVAGGGQQGRNGFGSVGYRGPCPPRGHGPHRYVFTLSALDLASLGLPAGASRAQLDTAMRGHVLASATYTGTFERK